MGEVSRVAEQARKASRRLAWLSTEVKNTALSRMADSLLENEKQILTVNAKEMETARGTGKNAAFVDRLTLNHTRIKKMADGLRQIVKLPDPVGEVSSMWRRPNGLQIGRMRVPLGVIGIVYEARPEVTADAVGLCLKSGNAVVLRGGSESVRSNGVLVDILIEAASEAGLPEGCFEAIRTPDREAVRELLRQDRWVDLIIPRGGADLIRFIRENSTIPVIAHDRGLCHTYVDHPVDLQMAVEVCVNAKAERPGVCNAMETLLVHEAAAPAFLPRMAERFKQEGVELRGCERTQVLLPSAKPATEADWDTEYLDRILSIKVVGSLEEAIGHITRYGSGLAEAILTSDHSRAMRFVREVDASAVWVNASTRFTDGGEFGFGAEIGISTQKLHARGPMGLRELTCEKYICFGDGQVRYSAGTPKPEVQEVAA